MSYNQTIQHPSKSSSKLEQSLMYARIMSVFRHLVQYWQLTSAWRVVVAFGVPFILYTLTLAPTIYNLDSAELTTATVTGGLMRATGYPLYLFLGRLWAFLPIGDVGYRMNLFSAFSGALTVLFVERILYRLKIGTWATLSAVGLMASAPFFWSLSLVAEVYTLHTALMSLLILLLLEWGDRPSSEKLGVITLVLGLSMGHHLATSLLIPGAIWYVFITHFRIALKPRAVALALGGVILGLSIYLYLPLRYLNSPVFNYAGTFDAAGQFHPINLLTPSGLWWLITGKSFAAQMFAYHGMELWGEITWFVGHLGRAFFLTGLGPGLLGMGVIFRRNWKLGGMLFLLFAFSALFYIDYRVLDKETMFLPTYVIWAIWLGVGFQWLLDWVNDADSSAIKIWTPRIVKGVMAVSVVAAVCTTYPKVDLSDDWSTRARGEAILKAMEPNALVLGWWDTIPVIQYLQLVEGQRQDIQAINRFLISYEDLSSLVEDQIVSRPIYINELPLDWQGTFKTQKAGPVYRIIPRQVGD